MFDDLFGGMIDFNGDGHTDFVEEMYGLAIIDDMEKADRQESSYSPCIIPDEDLYSEDSISDDSEDKKEERRTEIELKKVDLDLQLVHLMLHEPGEDDEEIREEWEEKVQELNDKISELDDELFELDLM